MSKFGVNGVKWSRVGAYSLYSSMRNYLFLLNKNI